MRFAILCLACCCACGSLQSDPDGGATTDAGPAADAAALPLCTLTKPFGTPVPVPGLSNPSSFERSARFSSDELTAYFIADIKAGVVIHVATRPDRGKAFGNYVALNWTSSSSLPSKPYDPFVTADGLTLYFGVFGGPDVSDIKAIARSNASVPFDPPAASSVPVINSAVHDLEPFIASDGAMWFSSDRGPPSNQFDIHRAAANANGFDPPVRVTELGSAKDESLPVLTPDLKEIYFSSDRSTFPKQIWMATRASSSDPFSAPVLAPNLSSSSKDEPSWISPDGCRLYLHSGRLGGIDIFVATRPL